MGVAKLSVNPGRDQRLTRLPQVVRVPHADDRPVANVEQPDAIGRVEGRPVHAGCEVSFGSPIM